MTTTRGIRSLVAAGFLLAALTGCANDNNDPAATPTPARDSPSSTASASPSETPTSDSEIASQAASSKVREYFATVDLVRQDDGEPVSALHAVTSSTERLVQKKMLGSQRDAGRRQVGDTKVVEVNVESVSLDQPATAIVDVCWDVSSVDVVDRTGTSVVSADRKDVGWTRFTVTNDKWKTAPTDGWRVSGGSDLEKTPCVGS